MTFLDKIIGSDYKKNLYFLFQLFQLKGFRLFGYLFEAVMFSSIVTLLVCLACMLFTKNDGLINMVGAFIFISLLLSSYKSSKKHFLIFEKMLKSCALDEKNGNVNSNKG